jgi:hypothetical protein
MFTDLTADGLLNGWVGDLIDESMRSMGRWLMMMMEVIAAVKRSELV